MMSIERWKRGEEVRCFGTSVFFSSLIEGGSVHTPVTAFALGGAGADQKRSFWKNHLFLPAL